MAGVAVEVAIATEANRAATVARRRQRRRIWQLPGIAGSPSLFWWASLQLQVVLVPPRQF